VDELNLNSLRAQKARLSSHVGKMGFEVMVALTWIFGAVTVYFFIKEGAATHAGYAFLSLSLLIFSIAIWDKWDLQNNPPIEKANSLDDILESKLLADFKKADKVTPRIAWAAATKQWQAVFLCNHLVIEPSQINTLLSDDGQNMHLVWQTANDLRERSGSDELHAGTLATALIASSVEAIKYLEASNIKLDDIVEVYVWLERLHKFINSPKPYFGGIGRDWATGFTPTLDRFATNVSREVESGRRHFHTLAHADILDPIAHNLNSGSVAIIGDAGTGKSSVVYALAERLLEGRDPGLKYYQIFSLDPSAILSAAKGSLESIMLSLFAEAAHARNAIIFLDDARAFFSEGTGSFNAAQIIAPLLQNHAVKIIAALTPDDFQQLKTTNPELVTQMPTVAVKEPDKPTTLEILEDSALTLEAQNNFVVSYQAVKEAYMLSNQYMQDLSQPGKAISLLQQAVPYAAPKLMTAESVQMAVEKTKGVKVAKAEAPEADILLHLEDKIHERMINQARAVKVVSSALRRGRAGVADPKRPIGSFLFLGPTGVGKTELARSLAATYFNDEHRMIRLDMSEFQQESDVSRLLATGGSTSKSLILQIREQPFSVVLLDEVEKAHPNILNLLLQILDEGQLTDEKGKASSFKNAIIIATSNAGSAEITQRVGNGDKLESFERPLIEKLINKGQFKAELINRFDEIVLFRPLTKEELAQVAGIMLNEVNKTLSNQNIVVKLTDAALVKVVEAGYDPEFGARPMRRALQKMVEDSVAKKVLNGEAKPGSEITLDVGDLSD
jgi:ATP-dependent Clp protease ATP-binding subunit ClpC